MTLLEHGEREDVGPSWREFVLWRASDNSSCPLPLPPSLLSISQQANAFYQTTLKFCRSHGQSNGAKDQNFGNPESKQIPFPMDCRKEQHL